MTLPPDELKAVAEVVYPELHPRLVHDSDLVFLKHKLVPDELGRYTGGLKEEQIWFNPSLTGTERERAQACDVIVAASKLKNFHLMIWPDGFSIEYTDEYGNERATTPLTPDILTAAMRAILEAGK